MVAQKKTRRLGKMLRFMTQGAPVAQRLALRAYSRVTTIWLYHKSRSCEERDGRGFKPLLEHFVFSYFFEFLSDIKMVDGSK